MSEQTMPFTFDVLNQVAETNVCISLFMATAFLKERGIPISEYSAFMRDRLGPGWEHLRGRGAKVFAVPVALNLISTGATLVELSGDERRAEVVVEQNIQPWLDDAGLTRDDFRPMLEFFALLAEGLGLHCSWSWEGNRESWTFTQ